MEFATYHNYIVVHSVEWALVLRWLNPYKYNGSQIYIQHRTNSNTLCVSFKCVINAFIFQGISETFKCVCLIFLLYRVNTADDKKVVSGFSKSLNFFCTLNKKDRAGTFTHSVLFYCHESLSHQFCGFLHRTFFSNYHCCSNFEVD